MWNISEQNPKRIMTKCNSLTSARLNYLYQSANTLLQESSKRKAKKKQKIKNKESKTKINEKKICKNNEKVANYYSQLMVRIGQGAVQRLSKNLKRTICKGCRSLLIPGTNAEICKIDKKQRKFGSICSMCQTKKMFPIKAQKKKSPKKAWLKFIATIFANLSRLAPTIFYVKEDFIQKQSLFQGNIWPNLRWYFQFVIYSHPQKNSEWKHCPQFFHFGCWFIFWGWNPIENSSLMMVLANFFRFLVHTNFFFGIIDHGRVIGIANGASRFGKKNWRSSF